MYEETEEGSPTMKRARFVALVMCAYMAFNPIAAEASAARENETIETEDATASETAAESEDEEAAPAENVAEKEDAAAPAETVAEKEDAAAPAETAAESEDEEAAPAETASDEVCEDVPEIDSDDETGETADAGSDDVKTTPETAGESEGKTETAGDEVCEDVPETDSNDESRDTPKTDSNDEIRDTPEADSDDETRERPEAGADCADPSSGGNEIVIDVNSGAQRSADFVSADETIQTDAGPYELIMYGLKEGNKDAVIAALEGNYDPESRDVLKLVDAAFADAEKYDSTPDDLWNTYDSNQCWAASAANMLWMSGWAGDLINPLTNAPFASEDELFVFFNENFSDSGAEVSAGIDWFFTGEFYNPGYSVARATLLHPKDPENGLMKDFASMLVQERFDLIQNPGDIARLTDCDWESETPAVFQASLGELLDGKVSRSGHSVTVAGVVLDTIADKIQDLFKSILLINSDDDAAPSEAAAAIENPTKEQKNADKAARPNAVSLYNLAYIVDVEGTPCWQLLGYDSDEPEIIYAINRLPLYSRELVEQYTETEGTRNIVDNVDLKFGTAFTTGETERIIDLYGKDEKKLTKIDFQQGEPVNVNYFVANMGSNILTETYTDGRPLTVDWKVVRDADHEIIAQGRDSCALPIYYGIELGFMSHLNQADGELQEWEPGTYTLFLDLNTDRNVEEAYYLNNIQKAVPFTILGEEEPENPDDQGGSGEPDGPADEGDAKDPDGAEASKGAEDSGEPGASTDEGESEDSEGSGASEDEEGTKKPGGADDSDEAEAAEDDGQTGNAGETAAGSNKTIKADSPRTGDSRRPMLWLITVLLALLACLKAAGTTCVTRALPSAL